jgi:hypothetical protein
MVSYPRRQRYRRLWRAVECGTLGAVALLASLIMIGAHLTTAALAFATLGAALGVRSRRWMGLARRSAIGAGSERSVRNRLRALEREGWTITHSLGWRGGGDIDHVASAPRPLRIKFAIETKTRSYQSADLARISEIAAWLSGSWFGWSRQESIPVLCLAGARGVERWEAGVAVVSIERLLPLLRRLAATTPFR